MVVMELDLRHLRSNNEVGTERQEDCPMKHLTFRLPCAPSRSRRSPAAPATRRQTSASHAAPDANFSSYTTFGFPEQTGTDRGGYSTLVTSYFKAAVRDQMEQRGYHYVDENPDLLVNFYAKVHERTEARPEPSVLGRRMATTAIAMACTTRGRSMTTTSAPSRTRSARRTSTSSMRARSR